MYIYAQIMVSNTTMCQHLQEITPGRATICIAFKPPVWQTPVASFTNMAVWKIQLDPQYNTFHHNMVEYVVLWVQLNFPYSVLRCG